MLTSQEIRQQFIDFFKDKNHSFVRSSSVAPNDDPTLLFTNAGMNQFKDIFLGTGTREYSRAVNSQKCIRVSGKHNDLEEVGVDTYHHTFFEMLGNWSFGDYYKKQAIKWSWELLTEVWKLPKDKLYATVFETDDEAFEIWETETDINPKHILRCGAKDNFWEMGETGPCGPCTEIHIDKGGEEDIDGTHPTRGVNSENERFMEIWNNVFIQYERQKDGSLQELPKKHVDTGMGFERIVAVLQDKTSNYDTDIFTPILKQISDVTGKAYEGENQVSMNVIADHIRTLTFSIADGALPSNEGRGYVLRRVLRRACRFGRKLGMKEPFFYKIVDSVVDSMGKAFPEIVSGKEHIKLVLKNEEESFNKTIDRGIELFEEIANKSDKFFSGKEAFKLYDTYGFPLDLTEVMAREIGLEVDVETYAREMEAQRSRSREATKFAAEDLELEVVDEGEHSYFVGYTTLETEAHLRLAKVDGEKINFVTDITPFYAESGGQVGDKGRFIFANGEFEIYDTQKKGDIFIHFAKNPNGAISEIPKSGKLVVDSANRKATAQNHTATHLLHSALRKVLGDHVQQKGSLVESSYLRFDFTHFEKVSAEQLVEIENLVNSEIQKSVSLETKEMSYDEAIEFGAMALFGEKYGDVVRVVKAGDFSVELCGGTHLQNTGEIGYFRILSESSISSGIRRIEAVSGMRATEIARQESLSLDTVKRTLSATNDNLGDKLQQLLEEKKTLEKEVATLKKEVAKSGSDDLLSEAVEVNGFKVLEKELEVGNAGELRDFADSVRGKLGSGVGVLGAKFGEKASIVVVVTDDLIKKGIKAGNVIREVCKVAGGNGGGKPHQAMGGGNPEKLQDALSAVVGILS